VIARELLAECSYLTAWVGHCSTVGRQLLRNWSYLLCLCANTDGSAEIGTEPTPGVTGP
jgi:hypothetical protein